MRAQPQALRGIADEERFAALRDHRFVRGGERGVGEGMARS